MGYLGYYCKRRIILCGPCFTLMLCTKFDVLLRNETANKWFEAGRSPCYSCSYGASGDHLHVNATPA